MASRKLLSDSTVKVALRLVEDEITNGQGGKGDINVKQSLFDARRELAALSSRGAETKQTRTRNNKNQTTPPPVTE